MTDAGVALVTGSTRGIGWATARVLARDGMAVIVTGRVEADAADRASQLATDFGVETVGLVCDVGDPASVSALFQSIFGKFHRLDVAVANAEPAAR